MFHQGPYDHLHPALQAFVDPVDMLAAFHPLLALAAVDPSAALNAISTSLRFLNPALNPAAAHLAFNPGAAPALAVGNPAGAALALAPLYVLSGAGGRPPQPGFGGGWPRPFAVV